MKNRFILFKGVILYGNELANILTKAMIETPNRRYMYLKLILSMVRGKINSPLRDCPRACIYLFLFTSKIMSQEYPWALFCFSLTVIVVVAAAGKYELCYVVVGIQIPQPVSLNQRRREKVDHFFEKICLILNQN